MIYSFLYVLIASMGLALTEFLYLQIPPLFSLFIASLIAVLFFNFINIRQLRHMYKGCWEQKWLYLAMMVTVLVIWICSMIAPGLIGASLYGFLYFTWLGMIGFFSLCYINWKKSEVGFYFGLATFALISFTIWSELRLHISYSVILGMLLSFIGGTAAFIYFKQSQLIMKRAKLSATQILAVRFYLTIIVSFILIPRGAFAVNFTGENLLGIACLTLLIFIAPLFFQQKALEKMTAEKNAIIISLTPAVTACIQELIFKNVSLWHIFVYGAYTFLVMLSYIANNPKALRERKRKK